MPRFAYHPELVERYPSIVGGVIHATGVTSGPSPAGLVAAFRDEQRAVLARVGSAPLSELPSLAAWRRAFRAFGVEPTQYRCAAEALLRRLTKQGDIPSINLLVDMGNLVSIRYALPVAVFDQSPVSGGTTVRFASGEERFRDLGTETVEHPNAGEVIFVDDTGLVSARRWCWRQGAESAAGPATREIVVTVEGHHNGARDDVERATADLVALLGEFSAPAQIASAVLDRTSPSFG